MDDKKTVENLPNEPIHSAQSDLTNEPIEPSVQKTVLKTVLKTCVNKKKNPNLKDRVVKKNQQSEIKNKKVTSSDKTVTLPVINSKNFIMTDLKTSFKKETVLCFVHTFFLFLFHA